MMHVWISLSRSCAVQFPFLRHLAGNIGFHFLFVLGFSFCRRMAASALLSRRSAKRFFFSDLNLLHHCFHHVELILDSKVQVRVSLK
jgi:hypothetical protein